MRIDTDKQIDFYKNDSISVARLDVANLREYVETLSNCFIDQLNTYRIKKSHPLASLMETLGMLVESYEAQSFQEMEGSPIRTLHILMEDHKIKQSDLPEIGSQAVISEILSQKRKLNARQIKALAKRFNVSPAVFM